MISFVPIIIFTGGAAVWKQSNPWDAESLSHLLSGKLYTVDMTPNGYADAVTQVEGVCMYMFVF